MFKRFLLSRLHKRPRKALRAAMPSLFPAGLRCVLLGSYDSGRSSFLITLLLAAGNSFKANDISCGPGGPGLTVDADVFGTGVLHVTELASVPTHVMHHFKQEASLLVMDSADGDADASHSLAVRSVVQSGLEAVLHGHPKVLQASPSWWESKEEHDVSSHPDDGRHLAANTALMFASLRHVAHALYVQKEAREVGEDHEGAVPMDYVLPGGEDGRDLDAWFDSTREFLLQASMAARQNIELVIVGEDLLEAHAACYEGSLDDHLADGKARVAALRRFITEEFPTRVHFLNLSDPSSPAAQEEVLKVMKSALGSYGYSLPGASTGSAVPFPSHP